MRRPCPAEGRLARLFRERYLRSLDAYRFFYDDLATLGDPATAEQVFYFVPGINGTPGQIRFVLPSLIHTYGSRLHIRALHVPEFSARRPTWEKYTFANLERKLARLREDLADLLARHPRITVIASSSGFYDFAAAASALPAEILEERVHLIWGACAPDRFEPTPWERVFYPLNGFEHQGHRWFAYPNHNCLKFFNPETSHAFDWCEAGQDRRFRKADLESRFTVAGIEWDYLSTSQLSAATRYVGQQIRGPLRCPAHALVAAHDGYWQGQPQPRIERTIRDYLPNVTLLFRPASHLWVVNPTFATELFRQTRLHDSYRRSCDAVFAAADSRGQSLPSPNPEDSATAPLVSES